MQPEIYEISFKDNPIIQVDRVIKSNRDLFSFFNLNEGLPYIMEAWKRSAAYRRTRIRERGLYFLCLLTRNRKIEDAIRTGGYDSIQKSALLITEVDLSGLFGDDICFEAKQYENREEKAKESYFEMTLVEEELIK